MYTVMWAFLQAPAAADTVVRYEHDFRPGGYGFRVRAPDTVQRTTFQKDDSSDAGAVVDGEPLEIRDQTGQFRSLPGARIVKLKLSCPTHRQISLHRFVDDSVRHFTGG